MDLVEKEPDYRDAGLSHLPPPASDTMDSFFRDVKIYPLNLGFVLEIGCQKVAVATKEDLIAYLTDYFTDPGKTEKNYYADFYGKRN